MTASGARRLVMMIGTSCRTQASTSWASRSFEAWTIWLTAKGAIRRDGSAARASASVVVIRVSHSSSMACGRAFRAGNEPTTPARHWAITRSGPETMNIGEAMTGRARRPRRTGGSRSSAAGVGTASLMGTSPCPGRTNRVSGSSRGLLPSSRRGSGPGHAAMWFARPRRTCQTSASHRSAHRSDGARNRAIVSAFLDIPRIERAPCPKCRTLFRTAEREEIRDPA